MLASELPEERPSNTPSPRSFGESLATRFGRPRRFGVGAGFELFGLAVVLYGLVSGSVNPYATFSYATLVYVPDAVISGYGVLLTFLGLVLHVVGV